MTNVSVHPQPISTPTARSAKKQSSFWRTFALACLVVFILGGVVIGVLGYWGYQKVRELARMNNLEDLGSSLKNTVSNSIQGATGSGNLGTDLLSYNHSVSLNGVVNQNKTLKVSGSKLYVLATAQDVTGADGFVKLRDVRGAHIGDTITLSKSSVLSRQLHSLGGEGASGLAAGDAKYSVTPGTYTLEVTVKGVWNIQVLSDGEVKE